MSAFGFIKGLVAAVTPSTDTRTRENINPCRRSPHIREEENSWFANRAYAAGYVSDEGNILYLTVSEPKKDKFGRSFHCIGLTAKLHHAKLFANKRKIYLAKTKLTLAPKDKMAREYLNKAFPVPVIAKPSIPNTNNNNEPVEDFSYDHTEEDSAV